jgi:predicted small lipoprotein YifL
MKRFSPFLLTLFFLLSFAGCGKKGPLLPPLLKVPKKIEVTNAIQRGSRVILEWENPTAYIDGSPLPAIEEVEVWLYENDNGSVGRKEFEEGARLIAAIKREEFPERQMEKEDGSSRLFYCHELSKRDYGLKSLIFGLRVKEKKKRKSEFSDLLSVTPRILSLPPQGVQASTHEDRIEIKWSAPGKNTDETSPAHFKGYNIYRIEGEGLPRRLNSQLIKERRYEDRDFLLESVYRYFIRTSAIDTPPFLESEDSEVIEVQAKDTFPPSPPSGLVSVAAENLISLSWDAGKEKDLAGYRVWRKVEGRDEYVLLTPEPIQENAYIDTAVEKNKRYYYAITARDKSGNESRKSESVSEIIKG